MIYKFFCNVNTHILYIVSLKSRNPRNIKVFGKNFPNSLQSNPKTNKNRYTTYKNIKDVAQLNIKNFDFLFNNNQVILYNLCFFHKYNCRINFKIYTTIYTFKYLFKYVYKFDNRITISVKVNKMKVECYLSSRYTSQQTRYSKF